MHVDLAATIGLEVKSKMIDILDGSQTIMLKIWDTAGQERFQSISRSYYQKADGIFVVFDLSKKDISRKEVVHIKFSDKFVLFFNIFLIKN